MADVYLTKIERKTIFTRALIYVLILFVVSDLTVTGPFFVNFIPVLYILSVLISIRGVDKVLTGIIGTFTVFIASLITNCGLNITTLLETLNAVIQLGLGMLSAHIIHEFVLDHRLVKYIKPKKKALFVVFLVLFTILSLMLSSIVHGDIFTYLKSKSNLEEYVKKVYDVEYEIKKVIYDRNLPGKYAYTVVVDKEEINFVPVLDTAFEDTNWEQRLALKTQEANRELSSKLEELLMDATVLKANSFELRYEYTKASIMPDSLILYITLDTEDKIVYTEIANSVKKILEIKPNITEFNILLNGTNLHIDSKNIDLVTPEYIEGGFNIEDLDE